MTSDAVQEEAIRRLTRFRVAFAHWLAEIFVLLFGCFAVASRIRNSSMTASSATGAGSSR